MYTILSTLRATLSSTGYDSREVRSIVLLLLEEVASMNRTEALLAYSDSLAPHTPERGALSRPLSIQEKEQWEAIIEGLKKGCPVQQVLGYEWFCGRQFRVTPDVLIPRPETAELVDWILSTPLPTPTTPHLLDIGTGSGCIAISLAAALPEAQVVGLDISDAALSVATDNAKRLEIENVSWCLEDILRCASQHQNPLPAGHKVDLIVSNPPYIRDSERNEMSARVLDHEPHTALFVTDSDPLIFYRAVAEVGNDILNSGGWIYFELNAALSKETVTLMQQMGYIDIELRRDIADRERMLRCRKR